MVILYVIQRISKKGKLLSYKRKYLKNWESIDQYYFSNYINKKTLWVHSQYQRISMNWDCKLPNIRRKINCKIKKLIKRK